MRRRWSGVSAALCLWETSRRTPSRTSQARRSRRIGTGIGRATFRLAETVDRYDQRSGHTEYRNGDADGHKAGRLTGRWMWREEHIELTEKPAVPQ